MTNGEKQKAIDALKISAPVMAMTQEEFNDYIQTLNKVMDWLEQEPIKNDLGVDAVSRQAVLDLIADYDLSMGQVVRGIHALPSVTPQEPKTGHWIRRNAFLVPWKCSECNYESERYENYCPNCGAKIDWESNHE